MTSHLRSWNKIPSKKDDYYSVCGDSLWLYFQVNRDSIFEVDCVECLKIVDADRKRAAKVKAKEVSNE